jgi:hypothetical protein
MDSTATQVRIFWVFYFPFRALHLDLNNFNQKYTMAICITVIGCNIMQYNLILSKILMFLKILS